MYHRGAGWTGIGVPNPPKKRDQIIIRKNNQNKVFEKNRNVTKTLKKLRSAYKLYFFQHGFNIHPFSDSGCYSEQLIRFMIFGA